MSADLDVKNVDCLVENLVAIKIHLHKIIKVIVTSIILSQKIILFCAPEFLWEEEIMFLSYRPQTKNYFITLTNFVCRIGD